MPNDTSVQQVSSHSALTFASFMQTSFMHDAHVSIIATVEKTFVLNHCIVVKA